MFQCPTSGEETKKGKRGHASATYAKKGLHLLLKGGVVVLPYEVFESKISNEVLLILSNAILRGLRLFQNSCKFVLKKHFTIMIN